MSKVLNIRTIIKKDQLYEKKINEYKLKNTIITSQILIHSFA